MEWIGAVQAGHTTHTSRGVLQQRRAALVYPTRPIMLRDTHQWTEHVTLSCLRTLVDSVVFFWGLLVLSVPDFVGGVFRFRRWEDGDDSI